MLNYDNQLLSVSLYLLGRYESGAFPKKTSYSFKKLFNYFVNLNFNIITICNLTLFLCLLACFNIQINMKQASNQFIMKAEVEKKTTKPSIFYNWISLH